MCMFEKFFDSKLKWPNSMKHLESSEMTSNSMMSGLMSCNWTGKEVGNKMSAVHVLQPSQYFSILILTANLNRFCHWEMNAIGEHWASSSIVFASEAY
jgi:hypothetical protein